MGKKVLIVGGVAGGATAATRLSRIDPDAEIILFERGEYISYANCGLPYHVGDVIRSRDALLLQRPEDFKRKFGVDARVSNEVLSIDRDAKSVSVRNLLTGEVYSEAYDYLILSTGSSPIKPPIPGIDSPGIFTLWTVPDTDKIRDYIQQHQIRDAVVIGCGFIGLEMAENLHERGIEVTQVEMMNQVMAPLDFEMAQLLHEEIDRNGVRLNLGDGVSSFETSSGRITVTLASGKRLIPTW